MKIIQKFLLKLQYPRLNFSDINSQGGVYTDSGEDTFIMTTIINSLNNNNHKRIIEIDRNPEAHYSLTSIFVNSFACDAYLLNTEKKIILSYGLGINELPGLTDLVATDNVADFGITGKLKETARLYEYSSDDSLLQSLNSQMDRLNLLIVTYKPSAVSLMKQLMNTTKVYFVLLQNNSEGFFSRGDHYIREYLLKLGYVYHSRLNGKHDMFILSDFVNGFPSASLRLLNSKLLQKWISEPPGSDYTKPR